MLQLKRIAPLLILFITLALGASVYAQEWHAYSSKSSLFTLRIPNNVVEEPRGLRIGPNRIAQVGQAISTIDERPYKDTIKNYIVKYEQTIGPQLTDDEIAELLVRELDVFTEYYKKLEGVQKHREELTYQNGIPASELYISYQDPTLGPQSIRLRVLYPRSGKILHIATGPEKTMDSFQTQKYFESMTAKEGYKRRPIPIREEWKPVDTPLGIFTAYLPEVMDPYVPGPAKVSSSDTVDRLSIRFYDPIWKNVIFYRVYGYQLKGNLNYLTAEKAVKKYHILRHRLKADNIDIVQFKSKKNIPGVRAEYSITPPENFPFVNWVKLRAEFFNDRLIVHEVMSSQRFAQSKFMDFVIENVDFHIEPQQETP